MGLISGPSRMQHKALGSPVKTLLSVNVMGVLITMEAVFDLSVLLLDITDDTLGKLSKQMSVCKLKSTYKSHQQQTGISIPPLRKLDTLFGHFNL